MKEIHDALNFINNFKFSKPEIGIVLGTGLGGLLENCVIKLSIPYADIPHFPISTVESHTGQLIFGENLDFLGNNTGRPKSDPRGSARFLLAQLFGEL